MDYEECLLAHLLNDESDSTLAPNVARVAHINPRIDV